MICYSSRRSWFHLMMPISPKLLAVDLLATTFAIFLPYQLTYTPASIAFQHGLEHDRSYIMHFSQPPVTQPYFDAPFEFHQRRSRCLLTSTSRLLPPRVSVMMMMLLTMMLIWYLVMTLSADICAEPPYSRRNELIVEERWCGSVMSLACLSAPVSPYAHTRGRSWWRAILLMRLRQDDGWVLPTITDCAYLPKVSISLDSWFRFRPHEPLIESLFSAWWCPRAISRSACELSSCRHRSLSLTLPPVLVSPQLRRTRRRRIRQVSLCSQLLLPLSRLEARRHHGNFIYLMLSRTTVDATNENTRNCSYCTWLIMKIKDTSFLPFLHTSSLYWFQRHFKLFYLDC